MGDSILLINASLCVLISMVLPRKLLSLLNQVKLSYLKI